MEPNRDKIVIYMTNYILPPHTEDILCIWDGCNIESSLQSIDLRNFAIDYAHAFCLNRLKIPFIYNDWEFYVDARTVTLTIYRRRIPYARDSTVDYSKMDCIATLRLFQVPSFRDYNLFSQDLARSLGAEI